MKKTIAMAAGLAACLVGAGNAAATEILFDFDDGVAQAASAQISGLGDYMSNIMGREVNTGDARWFGSSNTFASDAIFTRGYASIIDFDTVGRNASDFELTAVSLDWGVFDATPGRDFGLDVYDDASASWRNNVFEIFGARNGDTGSSGLITFDTGWEVTRLRFHDSGTYDVGMDNLRVWTNAAAIGQVPEPTTLLLMGLGLVGVARFRRR